MKQSKTKRALALVDQGFSAYAAAKQIGVSNVTVYKAVKARQAKAARVICPTCHRPLKTPYNKE